MEPSRAITWTAPVFSTVWSSKARSSPVTTTRNARVGSRPSVLTHPVIRLAGASVALAPPSGLPRPPPVKFPDVNSPNGTGTEATGINDKGDLAGLYFDSAGVQHGFVKRAGGKFKSI